MTRFTVIMGLVLLFARSGMAQTATQPAASRVPTTSSPMDNGMREQIAALDKLDFMLGTWKGSGWILLGPGRRAEFTQTEVVTRKLDGALLTIDGDGRDAANPERHIHSAFATITFSSESGKYRFMPYSGGHMLDVEPTIADQRLKWGYEAPYGQTRFTLDYSSGAWHETGELSRDGGKTWNKNFEMTLTRSGTAA